MENHIMIVLSNAVEGREDDFNDWYTNRHIVDVLRLDGFVSAQRFRLSETDPPQTAPFRYLAIYEVPEGRLDEARAALARARENRHVELLTSDAIDPDRSPWWYTALIERRTAPAVADSEPH